MSQTGKQLRDSLAESGWTPQLLANGIYCSPLCGGGCTKKEHDDAVSTAGKLAKEMGRGWSPVVWENLGWHWKITKGAIEITVAKDDAGAVGYTAWFNGEKQFIAPGRTPGEALANVTGKVRLHIDKLKEELDRSKP